MSRILLLKDDKVLSDEIQKTLNHDGYDVLIKDDEKLAFKRAKNEFFDLYIIDANTPFDERYDFLAKLRDMNDITPTLFITALRDLGKLSSAYFSGIDDYIRKPFKLDTLKVLVKHMINKHIDFIRYKNMEYDILNKIAILNNKRVPLTKVETLIFDLLIRNVGKDITKSKFFHVMERDSEMALRVHINKLKHKLNINIKNVRSVGYKLID